MVSNHLETPPFSYFHLGKAWFERGVYDALGGRTRAEFLARMPGVQEAIASRQPGTLPDFEPLPGDGLFDWSETLLAVHRATTKFTMIELGAGWGRWLVYGALAMKQTRDLPVELIGVEAEPTHFKWARQHIKDNGVSATLYRAAVAAEDGEAKFYSSLADAWYGQALVLTDLQPKPLITRVKRLIRREERRYMDTVQLVRTMSLRGLLSGVDQVDLIHSDIQGTEGVVFPSAMTEMDGKVRRVLIGTHFPEAEQNLREAFTEHGWTCIHDYRTGTESDTPFGRVRFQDGVQTWENPRLTAD